MYDLGLDLFRDVVVTADELKGRLLHTLLSMIEKERIGEAVNRSLLKSITQMLVDLGCVWEGERESKLEETETEEVDWKRWDKVHLLTFAAV